MAKRRRHGWPGRTSVRPNESIFFWKAVANFAELQEAVLGITLDRRGYVFRGYPAKARRDALGYLFLDPEETVRPAALVTGLERVCLQIDSNLSRARERERVLMREFKRRAHHYLATVPADANRLEWLALMQHHGAPTRLLDWTYSLQVAVHFAIAKTLRASSSHTPAVWMVDTRWCSEASARVSRVPAGQILSGRLAIDEADEPEVANTVLSKDASRCVWPINPFRLNERLTIQKGIFLAPGDPTATFVENFVALPEHKNPSHILHFLLPREQIDPIGQELYNANVTDATLFPGLDGFSQSLWLSSRYLSLEGLRP